MLIVGEQPISILCQQNIKVNYPTNKNAIMDATNCRQKVVCTIAENELDDIIGFTSASKRDSNPSPFQLCRNALSFRKLSRKRDRKTIVEGNLSLLLSKELPNYICRSLSYRIKHVIFMNIMGQSLEITIGGKVLKELV